jgi:hypothetical protein
MTKDKTYKLLGKYGIDDLRPIFAFVGNSQGDHSKSNDISVYEASKGWMSYIFTGPMTAENIEIESRQNREWNEMYVFDLKKSGKYGTTYESTITMAHNPLLDDTGINNANSPLTSHEFISLDLNKKAPGS